MDPLGNRSNIHFDELLLISRFGGGGGGEGCLELWVYGPCAAPAVGALCALNEMDSAAFAVVEVRLDIFRRSRDQPMIY